MPSWQFQRHINPNLTVSIPPEVASHLPPDSEVQIVLTTRSGDDAAWEHLTAEQFLEGYAPGDAIYDQLPEG